MGVKCARDRASFLGNPELVKGAQFLNSMLTDVFAVAAPGTVTLFSQNICIVIIATT